MVAENQLKTLSFPDGGFVCKIQSKVSNAPFFLQCHANEYELLV